MSVDENTRRRSTARAMWMLQLTPDERAAEERAADQHVVLVSDSPLHVVNDQPVAWHENLMRESLQRAMDRRP